MFMESGENENFLTKNYSMTLFVILFYLNVVGIKGWIFFLNIFGQRKKKVDISFLFYTV